MVYHCFLLSEIVGNTYCKEIQRSISFLKVKEPIMKVCYEGICLKVYSFSKVKSPIMKVPYGGRCLKVYSSFMVKVP